MGKTAKPDRLPTFVWRVRTVRTISATAAYRANLPTPEEMLEWLAQNDLNIRQPGEYKVRGWTVTAEDWRFLRPVANLRMFGWNYGPTVKSVPWVQEDVTVRT